ncbi:hypothetical protein [Anaerobium acetethylicum]|uniref:Uncharacterized protein n=1 Tax=Anaerobium acetethylicum TaxID=1619234 RepID=A0A1D3TU03_9FIRM|nr:hypothetical protein [Anaerobium acetethylicum]SCP97509.1 hypothetical protein SAMN05421730_101139 [Anaerobium acetethylicum]
MNRNIYRCHYRGQLKNNFAGQELDETLDKCRKNAERMIAEGRLMTAALYYHGGMLFLYFEAVGEEVRTEEFMEPMHGLLEKWPEKSGLSDWARMYQVFYHAIPESEEDWRRPVSPECRRGRIAYLKEENMFEYVYHHVAIIKEGLLAGDKYQSIALHEDILFSYFEEPKTLINVQRDLSRESKAIKAWLDVVPEDHFVPLRGSKGENFLFLPAYFALGQ